MLFTPKGCTCAQCLVVMSIVQVYSEDMLVSEAKVRVDSSGILQACWEQREQPTSWCVS